MSKQVRLCLIGAGGHSSRNIYPSLYRLKNAAVLANCDLDMPRAQTIAKLHGIPHTYGDYDQMLKEQSPDGVIVCVGHAGHAKLAEELLDRGIHVYTEKPNAPSLADSMKVLEAQKRSGLISMVAYKKRYAPAYMKTKAIIDSDEFGQTVGMNVVRSSAAGDISEDKMRTHMLDWTCHTLDLSVYLFGLIEQVTVDRKVGPRYGWAVSLRHTSGAVGQHLLTNASNIAQERVYVNGTGGIEVHVDNSINMLALRKGQPFAAHNPPFTTGSGFSDIEQGFSGELQAFVDAMLTGTQPSANIAQATHTIAVFEAMWQSAQTGKPEPVTFMPS